MMPMTRTATEDTIYEVDYLADNASEEAIRDVQAALDLVFETAELP